MVQGDEPMILPHMLNKICKFMLKNKESLVSNLITKIDSKLEFNDPNSIKLVKSKENKAIYFSRKAIPFQKNTLKNVGQNTRSASSKAESAAYVELINKNKKSVFGCGIHTSITLAPILAVISAINKL